MSAWYPNYLEAILSGGADVDLVSGDLRLALLDVEYVYDGAHEFFSSVPVTARVALSGSLLGTTTADGVLDADDVTVSNVPAGEDVTQMVLYVNTGADATSRLVLHLDSAAAGLPFTPDGGDRLIEWDPAGIASL